MRPRRLAAVAITLLALLAGVFAVPPAIPASSSIKKDGSKMTTPHVLLTLKAPSALVSESLPIEIVLRNGGAATLQIPDPDSPSVFQFMVRGIDAGLPSLSLSASATRLKRDPNPVPNLGSQGIALEPGKSQRYVDDLASYMPEPLSPGRYAVSVVHVGPGGVAQSPEVELRLLPLVPAAMAFTAIPTASMLVGAFAQPLESGGAVVLQRESLPDRPQDGISHRRENLPAPAAVASVAIATEVSADDEFPSGRWYAYALAGRVGAGVSSGSTNFLRVEPVELGLQDLRLHPIGWQPDVNHAVFVALGRNAAGKPTLALVNMLARERRAVVRLVPLAGDALPHAWAVQYRATGQGELAVVTAESEADQTRIYLQHVELRTGVTDLRVLLTKRQQPLAAMALPPLGADAALDLLLGPSGAKPRMTFLRQPLAGPASLPEFEFDAPIDSEQRLPSHWALAPGGTGLPAAVAMFRGQIIGRTLAPTGRGFVLETRARNAAQLQAAKVGKATYAIWVDAALGLQYRAFP